MSLSSISVEPYSKIQSSACYGYNKNVLIKQKIRIFSFLHKKKIGGEERGKKNFMGAVVDSNLKFSEDSLTVYTNLAREI